LRIIEDDCWDLLHDLGEESVSAAVAKRQAQYDKAGHENMVGDSAEGGSLK